MYAMKYVWEGQFRDLNTKMQKKTAGNLNGVSEDAWTLSVCDN